MKEDDHVTAVAPAPPERPEGAPDPAQQDWSSGAHPLTRRIKAYGERVRAFDARRPGLWDTAVTGFFVTAALVDASGGWRNITYNQDVPVPLVVALSLAFTVPLLLRRTHPLAAYLVTLPFGAVNGWTGAHLQAALIPLLFFFHIALRLPLRTLAVAFALSTPPLAIGATRHPVGSWDQQFLPAFYGILLAAALGLAVRTRQEYTASLVERARQLEVERDQQARLAAAAERTRIAREMHDIIGHNLSVITGLADGGAYAAAKSPERAAQALSAISSTSRQALAELRRLLDVLREDAPAARAPQPSLTDLDALLEGVREAGLKVGLETRGTPSPTLTPGLELTVYRVVQEALTNTLKHAGPDATAAVTLTHAPRHLSAEITDTAAPPTPAPAPTPAIPSSGQGLTGMRERTALYRGTLEAGPRPDGGGWRVHLRLPVEEPAP
ncbi:sensor histidine kinase [Streptomyces sp. NPDC050504]|uniref:sensor histidine kinase n=1 Tax=Streptomyces sp. NPDC050504 TaxID=3365618 RepID=UPI0037874295